MTLYIIKLDITNRIVKAYNNNIFVTSLRKGQPDIVLLEYQEKIYLLDIYVEEVIRDYYNNPL